MANSHTMANELATLSAELRYKNLVEQQPEIVQNVPTIYSVLFRNKTSKLKLNS
jgi:hypothetical protein